MKIKFLLLLLLFIPIALPGQITGTVISISDGDTFTLLTADRKQYKIRLHGIDCPEKNQPFGQEAKTFTGEMIFGKTIVLDSLDIDRYGRIVGIVYCDGKIINEELLHKGLALHYLKYDTRQTWTKLENIARLQKIGLWRESYPEAPWLWRKNKGNVESYRIVSYNKRQLFKRN